MIRRSFKRPGSWDHDGSYGQVQESQTGVLSPVHPSRSQQAIGLGRRVTSGITSSSNTVVHRQLAASVMDTAPQAADCANDAAVETRQEVHKQRRDVWPHQRATIKGDSGAMSSEGENLDESFIAGGKSDDDHRGYRTTKRLLGRLALALMGTYATCFIAERVLNFSGPVSALSNLTAYAAHHRSYAASTAWQGEVAECTGPEDGYVFGGDPGKVLSFVHKARSRSGVEQRGPRGYPDLSDLVRWVWASKRDSDVLAFKVGELETRTDTGAESGWECIFTANFGRSKPFPSRGPAESPWDPDAFNFYKANPHEFVLSYTPSFRYERQKSPAAGFVVAPPSPSSSMNAHIDGPAPIGLNGGALRGAGEGVALEKRAEPPAGFGLESVSSISCEEVSTALPPQDALLVNIKPVGLVSLLLTPGYPYSNNQRATSYALAVAMDYAEALRSEPGFRLGFNSGGSSASVNHLHFQCWYFDASETGGLPIETSETLYVGSLALPSGHRADADETARDMMDVYTLQGYPLRGLVFHTLGKDLEAVGDVIEKCVNFLLGVNTPHTMLFSTGRVFLLPRQHLQEPPFAVVPGFPEVSGQIIVTSEGDYAKLTADDIYNFWHEKIAVDARDFDRIVDACMT